MELTDVQKTKYYNAKEVAREMGISVWSLYRLVKLDKIKAINLAASGTRPIYGFKPESIQAYYDELRDSAGRIKTI